MKQKAIKATAGIATGVITASLAYYLLREDFGKIYAPIAFGVGYVIGHDEAERIIKSRLEKLQRKA